MVYGVEVLETLFVQLLKPKETINLEGLPTNVVPIRSLEQQITCRLPDDTEISVTRKQVPVITNFAITDYVSQGKTRPFNVIDPRYLETYQSTYTALSRGSTSSGTILLRGIDPVRVQGGLKMKHGDLFREMQQLELLDDITTQQYHGGVSPEVKGTLRLELIGSFLAVMGANYIPPSTDPNLGWTKSSKMAIPNCLSYSEWNLVDTSKKGKAIKSNDHLSPMQKMKQKHRRMNQ